MDATDQEVEAAAHAAGCDSFIGELEKGYDTLVGGGGAHLSGGERQRISIARAMLKDAPIVILDEATAYIDPENEAVIYFVVLALIGGETGGKTAWLALIADNTQKSQTALIEAVLETVQGMSVIKSFNLTGKGDKKLQDSLEFNRKSNLEVEKILTPYTAVQEFVLQLAGVGMMFGAICCWAAGTMSLANALMTLVMSFMVFGQIKAFGMGVSMLRLTAAAIERTVETEQMPQMDEKGRSFLPGAMTLSLNMWIFPMKRNRFCRIFL